MAISPQMVRYAQKTVKDNQLSFDVLSDPGNRVAGQFGLVFKFPDDLRNLYKDFGMDLEKFNGDDSWTLPMPGRFVVGQSSTIWCVEVDPDYTVRPDPLGTVKMLKSVLSQKTICSYCT